MVAMEDRNLSDTSARNRKLYKLAGVSFGLLCILQVALNITLRLAPYASNEATVLTENWDGKKWKQKMFDNYTQQGWLYFNHSFYYISSVIKSWNDSRDYCLQRGANLVIINSKEEEEFTRQFKRITWIGLMDTETEGTWKWVDGTLLNTSYWDTGEPNAYEGRNEDCVEIKNYGQENSWNDVSCSVQNFWICEKMLTL